MTFLSSIHLGAFLKLGLLDLTLGLNNAVLIVPTIMSIPAAIRRRAMLWGTLGAIGVRALLLLLAGALVGLPCVNLLAGGYLVYRGYRMLVSHDAAPASVTPHRSLFLAAAAIAAADMAMSVDNVLALAATARGQGGIAYAIAAVCVSIPAIMVGSRMLAHVGHRLPALGWLGGAVLGYVGSTIALSDPLIPDSNSWVMDFAPWLAAAAVIGFALLERRRTAATFP
jgi:predicted tellurium resistance membrane protein TerC